jgi:hypothetical protein
LAGARAGWVLSRESKINSGTPTPWVHAEGNTGRAVIARNGRVPRGQRPHACTEVHCAEAGRSPVSPVLAAGAGRVGKPEGVSRR